MIPERFGIRVMDDKGVQKQFGIIKRLISKAEKVVNCGDAGQEGELIQRWVMQQAGCKCPVERLWISSLTEEAIREGFANLKDAAAYQRLYMAGMARAVGDWLLGMNATRAYTIKYRSPDRTKKQVLSIGRVQTPTLALVVARHREIENFVPIPYWELKTLYRNTTFSAKSGRFDTEAEGAALLAKVTDKPLRITSISRKEGVEHSPRLFDLTSLQVECNKRYGFSADETLRYIQSLYEKKLTTYPRVDTTYLSEDMHPKIANILRGLVGYEELAAPLLAHPIPKKKNIFDNSKITDHHAIIPTGVKSNNLNGSEAKVYDMVARRLLSVFYPVCKIATTTVEADCEGIGFKVSGKEIIDPGWRILYQRTSEEHDEENDKEKEETTLPNFIKGEEGTHQPSFAMKKTTPPKPYTEATLLRAMETAGKLVEDGDLRDAMKENGIGRPSTRAAVIETLFKRDYIRKQRKSLSATQTGIQLIDAINDELIKSVELTGQWERKLRMIDQGNYDPQQFVDELKKLTSEVIQNVKQGKTAPAPPAITCPLCGGSILKGKSAYGCSGYVQGCDFRLPFEYYGDALTVGQMRSLIDRLKPRR